MKSVQTKIYLELINKAYIKAAKNILPELEWDLSGKILDDKLPLLLTIKSEIKRF